MRLRIRYAIALTCAVAVIAIGRTSFAQSQSQRAGVGTSVMVPGRQNGGVEQLPPGQMQASPMPAGQMGGESGYYSMGGGPCGCQGSCDNGCYENYCDQGCCEANSCGSSCCDGGWCGMGGGQFFFTADYLNVRATFSEATAKVVEDLNAGTDTFVPLEFDYKSSYRFGGGYRLDCCGDEIRFLFTRMDSDATATAVNGDIVPIEASPPPGGVTNISAGVNANTYDLECAKTIPLGGCCCNSSCGSCCDNCPTGCCNTCCRPCCPAWDITWSGGLRWGDVDSDRSFVAHDSNGTTVTDAFSTMEFHGGGLRTGLEGRRYWGKDGWFSVYAKGDISLLLGKVDLKVKRAVFDPSNPGVATAFNEQTFENTQIIPVTEIEGGVTAQVTRHAALTAGYLFSAWHDLGFRDEDQLNTLLPVRYDDANILGFDGFFARLEVAF